MQRGYQAGGEAATAGPWKFYPKSSGLEGDGEVRFQHPKLGETDILLKAWWDKNDSAFIVHSRTFSPIAATALITAIEALEEMAGDGPGGYLCDNDGRCCEACRSAELKLDEIRENWTPIL